jgi:hypothetical protein
MKKIIFVTGMFIFSFNLSKAQIMQDTLLVINFDDGSDSIISYHNISGTPWVVGNPQKALLDSAFSVPNGIITDSILPYLPGTYSYFEIPFMVNDYGNFDGNIFVCPLQICFQHRSDWDSISAGGWLSIRDNDQYFNNFNYPWGPTFSGNTYFYWTFELLDVIGATASTTNYDTLYNDTMGFRISNDAWRNTCLNMYYIGLGFGSRANDTLFYRFSFQSDTVANVSHGGWLIDEIQIGQGYGFCGGSIEENNNSRILLYPNPSGEIAYISTIGSFERGSYQLLDLKGKLVKEEIISFSEQIPIPLQNIAEGIYILRLNLDNKSYVKRLIKTN